MTPDLNVRVASQAGVSSPDRWGPGTRRAVLPPERILCVTQAGTEPWNAGAALKTGQPREPAGHVCYTRCAGPLPSRTACRTHLRQEHRRPAQEAERQVGVLTVSDTHGPVVTSLPPSQRPDPGPGARATVSPLATTDGRQMDSAAYKTGY